MAKQGLCSNFQLPFSSDEIGTTKKEFLLQSRITKQKQEGNKKEKKSSLKAALHWILTCVALRNTEPHMMGTSLSVPGASLVYEHCALQAGKEQHPACHSLRF